MKLTLIIEGNDYTQKTSNVGYVCTPIKREGKNGGIMLDGSKTVDVLAQKISVTYPMNPMTEAEVSEFYESVRKDYVNATVYDAFLAADRTAEFIPTVSAANAAIIRANGKWLNGITITLEER